MKLDFDISPSEYTILHSILVEYLTPKYKVFVFGSRAKNQATHNSDLDLAIQYEHKIDKKTLRLLKAAFEDARLAFTVDVLDVNAISDTFRSRIEKDMLPFSLKFESNVPVLRFSEFGGEWVEEKIGSILKIGSGKDYKHLDKGNIPVYGTGGYMTSVDDFLYDGESVCIGRKGTIDKPVILNGKFWTVDTLFYTHSFNEALPKFVYLLFQRINWKKYNEASGVPSLSKTTIEKISINLPTKPEQQKIATFLTSVDTKTEQLTQKVKYLEAYKKGVMQKLFSQEVRFRGDDGEVYGDWVERSLGDYGKLINGLTYSPDNIRDNGLLVLRLSNIQNQRISMNDKVYVNLTVSDESLTKENDILICVRNGSKRLIGKSIIIPKNLEKSTHGAFMSVFRGENNKFISHWFQTPAYYKEVHKNLGATINSINGSNLKKFKTLFPSSTEEQTKIANHLSAIDQKIQHTQKQLDETKMFKKGLLQKMFV